MIAGKYWWEFPMLCLLALPSCQFERAEKRCARIDNQARMSKSLRETDSLTATVNPQLAARGIPTIPDKPPATAQDSAFDRKIHMPPKPSEVAWYDEHCYEGKPR